MEESEPRSKIYINPEFKKAHFNRNFLPKATVSVPSDSSPLEPSMAACGAPSSSIHFNPAFLEKLRIKHQQEQLLALNAQQATDVYPSSLSNPIIQNTKRKLVRASSTVPPVIALSGGLRVPLQAPLVKISKNKLVRSVPVPTRGSSSVKPMEKVCKLVQPYRELYKLDRRPGFPGTIRKSLVKRYSLIRTNSISPQKVVVTDRRLLKLRRSKSITKKTSPSASFSSPNKKMVMININGVLYRSSSNKLQLSNASRIPPNTQAAPKPSVKKQERCLTIRGTRFLLDSSGTKLRKVPSVTTTDPVFSETKLRRIDIGGLTYMPKVDGTFVRTDNHRTRNYLSLAKQKSIQVLTNKMRTCNVSCPIFRRLGKCAAFMKGRCPKVHDPKHVTICPKFLKGECSQDDCLLSHNVSLEKMPVCRFFLEGRCMNDSCPYLHKKVSEKEQVCEDFLRGFCPLAAKCQRRHEFICPEFDRLGSCDRTKCPYPHKVKQKSVQTKSRQSVGSSAVVSVEQPAVTQRYYDHSTLANVDQRDELSGDQKVQLERLLGKVEKMKQGHRQEKTSDSASVATEDVNMPDTSEICEDSKSDQVMEIEDNSDEEADHRPPILKRAKLGPLPSFIPI